MLKGYKTYITGVLAVLGFWGAYLVGEAELATTIEASVTAILAMFLRAGMATEAKKIRVLLPAMLLILVGGCQASPSGFPENDPRHDYDWAQTNYNSVVQKLLTMKRAGTIEQADWNDTIYPLILEGDRILDQMEAAALAGNPSVLDVRITAFRAVFDKLSSWLLTETGADDGDPDGKAVVTGGAARDGDGLRGLGLSGQGAEPREAGNGQAATQGPGGPGWRGGDYTRRAA